jgi:hypothetical protein
MGKPILIAAFVMLVLLGGGPSWASYLETDPGTGTDVEPRIVPPRPVGNEITRLVGRLTVGRAYTTRNLMVFPLYVDGAADPARYVTLDEAVGNGWLKVYEHGGGRVQEVVVRNVSDHTIFLMAGEIISGARQNRVIRTDVLLRAHGPEVVVPVYCVERHRWTGDGAFTTEKSFANNELRYKAQSGAGQDAVWEEVARVAKAAEVESDTADFQDIVKDEATRKALAEYDGCMPRPPRHCIGAAIAINNRIVGVEVFANESLFAALWPKVRRGYGLDAYPIYETWEIYQKTARIAHVIDERDVRRFLDRVYDARFAARAGIDLGTLYAIRGNGLGGEGLVYESAESRTRTVIHVNFAPERYVIEPRRPGPVLE